MPDSALDILKLVLLVMLYLFFARVLYTVWSEVKQPVPTMRVGDPAPRTAGPAPEYGDSKPGRGRGSLPARIVVLEPKEQRGVAFALDSTVTVGREPDNTIAIADDTYLSGHHARISLGNGVVLLDDLTSRNGTFLNGTRISEPRTIKVGDRIQIGYTIFEAQ
jgi:pSer/pThr/pTyr-binding forkhead associated (FHA) protein